MVSHAVNLVHCVTIRDVHKILFKSSSIFSVFHHHRRHVLLVIHPIIQLSTVVLTLYVFRLGVQRFRSLHLHQKTLFSWKRHVLLGKIAMSALLGGMIGGMTMVYFYWHGFLITGLHGRTALVMIPFIIFSAASGLYMNHNKKKRTALPIIHGLTNLVLLILALTQAVTGWRVYMMLVLER